MYEDAAIVITSIFAMCVAFDIGYMVGKRNPESKDQIESLKRQIMFYKREASEAETYRDMCKHLTNQLEKTNKNIEVNIVPRMGFEGLTSGQIDKIIDKMGADILNPRKVYKHV